jgi:hypothetical protein
MHHVLSLVSLITDVPLQKSVQVRVSSIGGSSGLEDRLGVTMRGVGPEDGGERSPSPWLMEMSSPSVTVATSSCAG